MDHKNPSLSIQSRQDVWFSVIIIHNLCIGRWIVEAVVQVSFFFMMIQQVTKMMQGNPWSQGKQGEQFLLSEESLLLLNRDKKHTENPEVTSLSMQFQHSLKDFQEGESRPSELWNQLTCLHHFFERRVKVAPNDIAVEFVEVGQRLTYAQLNARANQLGENLRELGIRQDQRVGIYLPRGMEWYIAILGILKAGAAYLPIDAEFPLDRVRYILQDADAALVITNDFFMERLVDCARPMLSLDGYVWEEKFYQEISLQGESVPTEALCYVIYTSGTTGHPKGVCLSHVNVIAYVHAMLEVYGVCSSDRVLQGFSTSFDASVEEIWMAFATGATLVVGSLETMRVVDELPQKLRDFGITVFSTVPTLLAMLEPCDLPQLRLLIMGGEATRGDIIELWYAPHRRLLNTYGPTECAVVATFAECIPDHPVTIGRPMPGYDVAILNEQLQPVAAGEEGELCLAGLGVSLHGYLGRPELTSKKFIPYEGKRYYRTGDLVSLHANGELLFCGRIDAQVKIRGYRVELEEIETLIAKTVFAQQEDKSLCEGVVVGLHKDEAGTPQLIAYLLQHSPIPLDIGALLAQLRGHLPAYMVPTHFVSLHPDAVPRLTSGKIERRRLPVLSECHRLTVSSQDEAMDTDPFALCENEQERRLLQIWRDVLQAPVLPTDSFFDFGGNSVTAAEVISRCRQDGELESLAIRDLYQCPTVRTAVLRLQERIARQAAHNVTATGADDTESPVGLFVKNKQTEPAYEAPRGQYLRVSAAQTAVIVASFFTGTYSFLGVLWLIYAGWNTLLTVTSTVTASVVLVFSVFFVFPVLFLALTLGFGLFWKWLLIGKFREMEAPLWSWAYFRWWLVNFFLAPSRGVAAAFLGTPFAPFFYRLLGAKIGNHVYLGVPLHETDLITIEDGASLAAGVMINTRCIERGMLRLRPIHIGKHAFIGHETIISGGVHVGESCILHPLSCLAEGMVIPDCTEWRGSPAAQVIHEDTALAKMLKRHIAEAQPSDEWNTWRSRFGIYALQYLMSMLSSIVVLPSFLLYALMLWGLEVMFGAVSTLNLAILLPATLLFAAVNYASSLALLIAAKWLLTGRAKPGTISLNSFEYVRRWLCSSLMSILTSASGWRPFVETLLAPYVYRWLGMRVGKNVEISDMITGQPDLIHLGNCVMLADNCYIANPIIYRGRMTMDIVEIGDYTFVGNGAVVPITSPKVGSGCLLGVLSITPDGEVPDRTDWLGSPPLRLPKRIRSQAPEERTFKPSRGMYIARAFSNFWKIILPGSIFACFGWISIKAAVVGYMALSLTAFLLYLPVLFLVVAVVIFMMPVLLKWLLLGRFKAGEHYLWSAWMWRMETVYEVELAMTTNFGSLLHGTPWIVLWFRLMGAKLGRQVFISDGFLMETDLIRVGDHVTLAGTGLQTHLFEDRVMKLGSIQIDNKASLGASYVLYNTHVGENAVLGDLSLVMKNETLSAERQYHGLPAECVVSPLPSFPVSH